MNKLVAADKMAEAVENYLAIGTEEASARMEDSLSAYRQAPAMPSPERILEAMEHLISCPLPPDGKLTECRTGQHDIVLQTLDELRKALGGNEPRAIVNK